MSLLRRVVSTAIVAVAVIAPSVSAQSIFTFADLEHNPNYTGFLPTNGIFCTGGDLCSSDIDNNVFGGALHYNSGPFGVDATGFYRTSPANSYNQVSSMQDHEDGYNGTLFGTGAIGAGLGVYHESGNTSDDNITFGEMLKLTFSSAVQIDWISLHSDGHTTTGFADNSTYQYSTDGLNWVTDNLPKNTGKVDFGGSPLQTQTLYLRYDDANNNGSADQFYLSGVAVTATPEPSTFALMGLGLGALGTMIRRRRAK